MDSKLRRTNQERKNHVSVGMRDETEPGATAQTAPFEEMNFSLIIRQGKRKLSLQNNTEEKRSNMDA
jgi:hypothetical protein